MFIITKAQAASLGFTHHGSYFGIPLWLMVSGKGREFMVVCKMPMLDPLLHVSLKLADTFAWLTDGVEKSYQFKLGKQIG